MSPHPVAYQPKVEEQVPEARQLPRDLRRNGFHPSCECSQLRTLGNCRLYLQLYHSSPPLRLVDEIQL